LNSLNATITEQINIKKEKNWVDYISYIDYKTNNRKLQNIVRNIHTSKNSPSPTHETLLGHGGTIPSNKKQADKAMKYYASISHKHTIPSNRKIIKILKRIKTDNEAQTPFTT